MNREAKLVVLTSANFYFQPICQRQRIVTDQTRLIGWNTQELLSLMILEKLASAHPDLRTSADHKQSMAMQLLSARPLWSADS
ncbi:hypothetical protein AJ87_07630 [Rhizobium yanglingense]|nr:hypothetical protein AJ87_41920 [Rhizobium yanglingense]OWK25678.1 hypothetical protein AJ87_07630 [Rhizobium yanglingense]